jgi:DNA end-binding protein Ku
MLRPTANATISFGLVSASVRLYSLAESAARFSFNWLHKGCGSRLKQQYVCARDGAKVERDDMIKGYEYAKDQYVLLTEAEIKALDEVGTGTIEVAYFVPAERVPKTYHGTIQYLAPGETGKRAFVLLRDGMRQTGLAAVGRYAARGRQHLVLLVPFENAILLQYLHYADEVRSTSEIPAPEEAANAAELALVTQFLGAMRREEFDPYEYHDEVRGRVAELIDRKIAGEEIADLHNEAPAPAGIVDIMRALQDSIAATEQVRKPEKRVRTA